MREIEIIVRLTVDEDVNIMEVVNEMDYEFSHVAIKDTEIVDVVTEI